MELHLSCTNPSKWVTQDGEVLGCMPELCHYMQRFKIIDFLMGPWDEWAMILMGPRALGMGPIIDIFYTLEILGCVPRMQLVS